MQNNLTKIKIGNNLYTNIIFKNFNGKVIAEHLNKLDIKHIDWGINTLDQKILVTIFSTLLYSVRVKIYINLSKPNLVKLLANLDFYYLEEYLKKEKLDYNILLKIFNMIDKKYYDNMLYFLKKHDTIYINILLLINKKNEYYYYLIDNFPDKFFENRNLYSDDIIIKKLIMNKPNFEVKKILINYPKKLMIKRISNFEEVNLNFVTMILGISNIYYAPKFINYFSYFTFEEMKSLIGFLHPCYVLQLSKVTEINLTLYENLIPYMNNEQIRFLLSNCNIGFFKEIYRLLNKNQIIDSVNILDKVKFWIALKSISFNKLIYFLDGISNDQKELFLSSAMGLISNRKIFLSLLPQYQVLCFKYRRTFEIVIDYWDDIENYVSSFIIRVLNGKKLFILSEYCLTSDWENLIEYLDKYQISELENIIMKLSELNNENNNTYNLILFAKYYELEKALNYLDNILI